MKVLKVLSVLFLVILLGGCGSNTDKKNEPDTAKTELSSEVEEGQTTTDENTEENTSQFEFDLNFDQFAKPNENDVTAEMEVEKFGVIKIKLFKDKAPKTVENFVKHSKDGYYDGLSFHRVMDEFMIQGGDPLGNGTGGESIWGAPFEDEFKPELFPYRGALCMANSGPNTNGSQFFIVQKKSIEESEINPLVDAMKNAKFPEELIDKLMEKYKEVGGTSWLYFKHTVFGQVFEGMDVVDKIAKVETGEENNPLEKIIIKHVEIVD